MLCSSFRNSAVQFWTVESRPGTPLIISNGWSLIHILFTSLFVSSSVFGKQREVTWYFASDFSSCYLPCYKSLLMEHLPAKVTLVVALYLYWSTTMFVVSILYRPLSTNSGTPSLNHWMTGAGRPSIWCSKCKFDWVIGTVSTSLGGVDRTNSGAAEIQFWY